MVQCLRAARTFPEDQSLIPRRLMAVSNSREGIWCSFLAFMVIRHAHCIHGYPPTHVKLPGIWGLARKDSVCERAIYWFCRVAEKQHRSYVWARGDSLSLFPLCNLLRRLRPIALLTWFVLRGELWETTDGFVNRSGLIKICVWGKSFWSPLEREQRSRRDEAGGMFQQKSRWKSTQEGQCGEG